MADLAELTDVEQLWRTLEEIEKPRVRVLLVVASGMVRRHVAVPESGDAREAARLVVVEMVASAMLPEELRGKRQYSVTVGGIAESATLLNPAATLVLTDEMLKMLGVSPTDPHWHFSDDKEHS